MTLEEQIEDLKNQVEATASKNKELLSELRVAKNKNKDIDPDAYNKALDENEQLKEELSKLDKNSKIELEKLSKTLTDKDSKLKQILVTDGLRDAFVKNGADKELLDAVLALHQNKVQLSEDYTPNVDGKDLNTFAKEWLSGDGKRFLEFTPTSGGGSNGSGGSNGGDISKYFDKTSKEFNLTKQAEILRENPDLYKTLKG